MKKLFGISSLVLVTACASTPNGPNVMVLPGSGKTFDQFRFDDQECRQYAHLQSGGEAPNQAAANSGVASAAVGAAVGTVAGAALGGSRGAGVGAGLGLATGAVAGSGAAAQSGHTAQRRYDMGYQQCMYAKGHKIPMAASRYDRKPSTYREATPPPPPPGTPPPPPPRG
jgi:outer membrane lipoprotein SlyB